VKIVDREIDLHRLTVEEALPKLDDFIYHSFTSGCATVCINHGRGSGTLRQAVQRELKKSTMVRSFRAGDYGEGGIGVTIVVLADH
jgi:DNA mismatch repair protein MutS2